MRFLFFFVFGCSLLFAKEKVDILFYVQDAGETNALIPVINNLEEKGYSIGILAAGVAEEMLKDQKIWTFVDFDGEPVSKKWERKSTLDPNVLHRLAEVIEPRVVITGVAFASQGQILDLYRGRPAFAFWDNFNSDGENPYFSTAHAVTLKASTLLLPTSEIEEDFKGPFEKIVVGHPTLDVWRQKMHPRKKAGTSLFIGGYGKDYEEAFALFLDCVEMSGGHFIVHLHPKTDGSFERSLLAQKPQLLVELSIEQSTIDAVDQADLVICHQSTVAFQALACGKPVIHIIPQGQVFETLPLKKGLTFKVSSPTEFVQALSNQKRIDLEVFDQLMGIPCNSAENIAQALIAALTGF